MAKKTGNQQKMSREDALRKLGTWRGFGFSYSSGAVLLGLQQVSRALRVFFHLFERHLPVGFRI